MRCRSRKECKMNHNPFMPREQCTAILTFDNGQRVRAEVLIPKTDRATWHDDIERRFIEDFHKSQPRAVNKLVKVHILRN